MINLLERVQNAPRNPNRHRSRLGLPRSLSTSSSSTFHLPSVGETEVLFNLNGRLYRQGPRLLVYNLQPTVAPDTPTSTPSTTPPRATPFPDSPVDIFGDMQAAEAFFGGVQRQFGVDPFQAEPVPTTPIRAPREPQEDLNNPPPPRRRRQHSPAPFLPPPPPRRQQQHQDLQDQPDQSQPRRDRTPTPRPSTTQRAFFDTRRECHSCHGAVHLAEARGCPKDLPGCTVVYCICCLVRMWSSDYKICHGCAAPLDQCEIEMTLTAPPPNRLLTEFLENLPVANQLQVYAEMYSVLTRRTALQRQLSWARNNAPPFQCDICHETEIPGELNRHCPASNRSCPENICLGCHYNLERYGMANNRSPVCRVPLTDIDLMRRREIAVLPVDHCQTCGVGSDNRDCGECGWRICGTCLGLRLRQTHPNGFMCPLCHEGSEIRTAAISDRRSFRRIDSDFNRNRLSTLARCSSKTP